MAEVKISITAEDKASGAFKSLENTTATATSKIKSAFDSLKQHWLAISATIISAIYIINKAWNLAEMAAKFEEQKASLNALAGQYNTTASQIISSVQEASKGMISMADAASVSAKALMMGMKPDQLIEFMRIVEATTNVTGQRVTSAFDQITEAAAMGRERSLKQMGIIVDLNNAYKSYAISIGKTTEQLTESERQQAAFNSILQKGSFIIGQLGDSSLSNSDKMEQLRVTVQDLQLQMGTGLIRVTLGAAGAFQWLAAGVMNAIGALTYLAEKGGWVSAVISPLGMILKKAGVDSATAFAAAEELAGESVETFKAMITSSEDLMKAMKTPIKESIADSIDEIKKIEDAYKTWIKTIDDLNPALNKNIKILNKLQEEADEFIKAGKNAVEVNKELARAISYLEATEKAEEYREAVKSQIGTIKEQIDALKLWRQTAVDAYNDAINRANAYYNTVKSLDEALLKSKSFLEDIKGKEPKIFGFEEEKRTLQTSIQIAFNTKDADEVLQVMGQMEKFILKYKGQKGFSGFDIDFSDILESYEGLIKRIEYFKDINQQAGDAWINKSIEITTAIQQIDSYVSALDTKLQSLQAILNVDQAVQAAQYLRGEIDFYLPDVIHKTIVINTVGAMGTMGGEESSFYGISQDKLIGYKPLQSGTPYVPQTGLYQLHKGEAVIPANQNTYNKSSQQVTYAPVININGANKSPQQIAIEVDKVLARRAKYNRSEFAREMN